MYECTNVRAYECTNSHRHAAYLQQKAGCIGGPNSRPYRRDAQKHHAPFRDKRCHFWHPLTLFLTPLAPRQPRDCEVRCLGPCSRMPQNLLPSSLPTYILSLSPLSQAQNIASPKMASHDLRAGSAKHGCLYSITTRTSSTTNMDTLPTFYVPLPRRSTSIGQWSKQAVQKAWPGVQARQAEGVGLDW